MISFPDKSATFGEEAASVSTLGKLSPNFGELDTSGDKSWDILRGNIIKKNPPISLFP